MDIFTKNASKDDRLAKDAADGDLDMVISPLDGKLVVVSQVGGVHVCGRCHEQFVDEPSHPKRPVEWNPPGGQGTRMHLHACCVNPAKSYPGNLLIDRVRGHQIRRFITQATKLLR